MPGYFQTPPTATAGSVIASAHVNLLGSNDSWFSGLLASPTAIGQVPISSGTADAAYGYVGSNSIVGSAIGSLQLGSASVGSVQLASGAVGTAALGAALTPRLPPAGLGGWFRTAAEIASGWTREGSLDGRFAIGVGTLFGGTFDALTDYGASWGHAHTVATSGSATLAAGSPGTVDTNFSGGGADAATAGHSHAVSATSGSTTWTIPARGYVAARRA